MSISGFFAAMRNKVLAPPTQHDLAIKAMTKVAEGAHRKLHGPRAPKRNLYWGPIKIVDWLKHKRNDKHVALKRQTMLDGSRYPKAHSYGIEGDPNRRP